MSELLPIQDLKIDFNELTSSLTHPELLTETFFIHFFGQLSGEENGEPVQTSEFPCFPFDQPFFISQPLNLNLSLNPSFHLQSERIEAPGQIPVPGTWTERGGSSLPLEEAGTDHPQEHLSGSWEEREAPLGKAIAIDVGSCSSLPSLGREEVSILSKNHLLCEKNHLVARTPSVATRSLSLFPEESVESESPEPYGSTQRTGVSFLSERSPLFTDVGIESPHHVFAETAKTSSERDIGSRLVSHQGAGPWKHVFKEAAPSHVETKRDEGEVSQHRSDVEPESNQNGGLSLLSNRPDVLIKKGEVGLLYPKSGDFNPRDPIEPSHGRGYEKAGSPKDFIPVSESPLPPEQIVSKRTAQVFQEMKAVLPQRPHGIEAIERIGRTIAWAARKGEERMEIRLEPPELGTLLIEITKERDVVKAIFWTENQTTRELLDAHKTELCRMLKEDGLRLEQFDVFVQQDVSFKGERRGFPSRGNPWGEVDIGEKEVCLASETSPLSPIEWHRLSDPQGRIDRIV